MNGAPARTMLHDTRGSLVVFTNGPPPSDAEWNSYLETIRAAAERHGRARVLVVPGPGVPSARQRQLASELSKRLSVRAAVISTSVVVGGIVTALRWLGVDVRAFPNLDAAAGFLEASKAEMEWAREAILTLRKKLADTPSAGTRSG